MSGPSQNLTDEQLAAALQQQYRMEFLQRQERHQQRHSQQDLTRMATAPASTEVVYNGSSDEVYARQLQRQMDREAASQSMPSPPHRIQNVGFQNNYSHIRPDAPQSRPDAPSNNGDIEDAILAQQMQDEELARQYSRRYNQQQQTRSTDTLFDDYTQTHATHDLETQRHLSQQLADAELAQQLAEREQAEALRRDREQRSQLENQSKWYRRILPLFILAAAITIPLLFVFGVFSKNDVPFLGGFGSDWVDSDPWSDVGSFNVDESGNSNVAVGDNAVRWATNGNGLQLEIWNAMEDKYDSLFATAVQNWDAGAPIDSLSLSTRKVNYDFECKDQDGILKICSGNYGATKWRGLNEVKLNSQTKVIVSSVAKMNNYYLDTESQEQRLYTICHELGHGFGLPHWDVDFYNRDLGNCMDYTIRPENNMKPSASNFEYLAQLYGGRNVATSAAQTPSLEATSGNDNAFDSANKDKKEKGKKGERRRVLHKSDTEEVHLVHAEEEDGILLLRHYRF